MGRSIAQFALAGQTREWLLGAAMAYAQEQQMRVEDISPVHVTLTKGSVWWTGKRVLRISAWDVPVGVTVTVEVWVEGLLELNANPSEFVGLIPRRAAWRLATGFVARLGVVPEAVFQHL